VVMFGGPREGREEGGSTSVLKDFICVVVGLGGLLPNKNTFSLVRK
jgi:hypothetical protein